MCPETRNRLARPDAAARVPFGSRLRAQPAFAALLGVLVALGGCAATGDRALGAGSTASVAAPASASAKPGEELWAIHCLGLTGRDRQQLAQKYASALQDVDGLRPGLVLVQHGQEESVVYYGRYAKSYDERSKVERYKPDPAGDLELVRKLSMTVNGQPVWPFRYATLEPLPGGGKSDIAQWELHKARGYWSLQVGVFYNEGEMRERKQAAEAYCKLLREQGEEAYFHHGPVNSSVCIGSFPKDAIRTIREVNSLTGVPTFKSKIVNPQMLALQKRYPFNLHNGAKFYEITRDATGRKIRDPHISFAVQIPRDETPQRGLE